MKKFTLCFFCIAKLVFSAASQNVGIGTSTPDATAQLEISSNNKGMLIPRLTTAQRDAIVNPANGLMIYNSSLNQYNFYNGTRWQNVNGVPKDGIILSRKYLDSIIIKEGYAQEGFITHDVAKQVFGDTVIPAGNWYRGNRLAYENSLAPGCNSYLAGYANTNLYVFDGDSIFIFNQGTDKWTARGIPSTNIIFILNYVENHKGTIIWSGTEFLFWGGGHTAYNTGPPFNIPIPAYYSNKGARYNPTTEVWTEMNFTNAPEARFKHKTVWTGTEMIIWGGKKGDDSLHNYLNTGAKYNPTTDSWTALPTPASFNGREDFIMVWGEFGTNKHLMIWGGKRIEPKTRPMVNPCTNNPSTGSYDSTHNFNDGRIYNPTANNWTVMSTSNSPPARHSSSAVWADYQLVIAGGVFTKAPVSYCGICNNPFPVPCWRIVSSDSLLKTAASFDPLTNTWTTVPNSPKPFSNATVFFDQSQFVTFFGGPDSIMSFEPSANDWFLTIIPRLLLDVTQGRTIAWRTSPVAGSNELITLPVACTSNRQDVYILKSTPTILKELKSTTVQPGQKLYLYKKE